MIAIVDYGMGNLGSVLKSFNRLGIKAAITDSASEIESASKILLPGVGAYGDGVNSLKNSGLFDVIDHEVRVSKKPILGICLGMQLLGKASEEAPGGESGFGFIDMTFQRFDVSDLKVPHVGWNDVDISHGSLFANIPNHSDFYFVHSFHAVCNEEQSVGVTEYGYPFVSAVELDNVFGVQFHPEKSQKYGLEILKNFGDI